MVQPIPSPRCGFQFGGLLPAQEDPTGSCSGRAAVRRCQELDLSQHSNSRLTENNFDLLRLLFSGIVVLVHAYELSGFQQLGIFTRVLSSTVAVKAFFVVSGFLIFMSYERSTTISAYSNKRIRRIYPAYFTVVMLCAIGLIAVSTKNIGDYLSLTWVKYVFANLAFLNFLQPTLPGVFDSNKLTAVNGALWTLKVEAMFLSVPLFVFLFRKFARFPILILVYCASVAYAEFFAIVAERTGSEIYMELGRQSYRDSFRTLWRVLSSIIFCRCLSVVSDIS